VGLVSSVDGVVRVDERLSSLVDDVAEEELPRLSL
jgi:hypothetical protein